MLTSSPRTSTQRSTPGATSTTSHLSWQLTPLPNQPSLQLQVKPPDVLVQVARGWQLCVACAHSSTSVQPSLRSQAKPAGHGPGVTRTSSRLSSQMSTVQATLSPGGGVPATHPVAGSQVSWPSQNSPLSQTRGVPPQNPPWQRSPSVQALPSLHAVPSGRGGLVHRPRLGLHAPSARHGLLDAQLTGLPPTHSPSTQLSVRVHRLLSLHGVPFGLATTRQPTAGLQKLCSRHASAGG